MDGYEQLPSDRSIRVFMLHTARSFSDSLSGHLEIVSHDEARGQYEALSYVWGENTTSQSISVGCRSVGITSNCDQALRHLRQHKQTRALWIDAICIDQSSAEDKAQQIPLMGDIYEYARRTVIWLALQPEDTRRANFLYSSASAAMSWGLSTDSMLGFLTKGLFRRRALESWATVITNSWFHRVWTNQELCFSNTVIVMCGNREMEWEKFIVVTDWHKLATLQRDVKVDERELPLSLGIASVLGRRMLRLTRVKFDSPEFLDTLRINHPDYDQNAAILSRLCSMIMKNDASDPRDNIYSIYRFLADRNIRLPVVDYTIEIHNLYEEFTRIVINVTGSLWILILAEQEGRSPTLPSWVPDWSCPSLPVDTRLDRYDIGAISAALLRGTPILVDTTEIPRTLFASAIFVSKIAERSEVFDPREFKPIDWLNSWVRVVFSGCKADDVIKAGGRWKKFIEVFEFEIGTLFDLLY